MGIPPPIWRGSRGDLALRRFYACFSLQTSANSVLFLVSAFFTLPEMLPELSLYKIV
jgi:hypothetical protein